MPNAFGYAATDASAPLAPFSFERRAPGLRDVKIKIDWCGVCHSDLHTARGEWGNTLYPSVPGHEIIGVVTEVGAQAAKYKVGDIVGVGCMVDSCRVCESCRSGLEQYCDTGFTGTSLWMDPAQGVFVLLLTNRVNPTRENRKIGGVRTALADAAVAALRGDPGR